METLSCNRALPGGRRSWCVRAAHTRTHTHTQGRRVCAHTYTHTHRDAVRMCTHTRAHTGTPCVRAAHTRAHRDAVRVQHTHTHAHTHGPMPVRGSGPTGGRLGRHSRAATREPLTAKGHQGPFWSERNSIAGYTCGDNQTQTLNRKRRASCPVEREPVSSWSWSQKGRCWWPYPSVPHP